ncbi:MAG: hypothetical protein FWE65_02325 [Eggerthellaceae bacterium]|nr:hypothetical protein [Eggerthellaceae bacterium]
MKKLVFHRRFEKQYLQLQPAQKERVKAALALFIVDARDPSLRVHRLIGEHKGQSSVSAGGDLRIHVLEDEDSETVVVLQVGSHSQLYG